MRAARLHGIRDLRIETLADPSPSSGELLIRVEACGVCPTDVRKFLIGVNDGDYPFNPGHEWVGRIAAVGADVEGWEVGERVYGDTYAGYAELALLPVEPGVWSHGPLRVPDELPLERAVLVEPLADCLHAVHDRGRTDPGDSVLVVGGGQMGQQLVCVAALAGAQVTLAEPRPERRATGLELGAVAAVPDAGELAERFDVVLLSVGSGALVEQALERAAVGGRVVLFAGFGDAGRHPIDLNAVHYRELELTGSEWVGTPPNQRREHYAEALRLLQGEAASLGRLVDRECGLDDLVDVFEDVAAQRLTKAVLRP